MKRFLLSNRLWLFVALIILLAYPLVEHSQYYQHVMIMTMMAAVLSSSWNILGGYAGYTSLGHAAFFGLGGYLVAWTHNHYGWHPFISTWFLAIIVFVVALILGWISLRTHGSAFVVVTIAMVFIFRLVALNLSDITNGARGLTQDRPGWGGLYWSPEIIKVPFHYIMLLLLCLTLFISWRIRQSKFGLGLIAIREDEGKAEAVGINTMLYKVLAFGISAYFIGRGLAPQGGAARRARGLRGGLRRRGQSAHRAAADGVGDRLRALGRPDGGDHVEGRRSRAVELPRLHGTAHAPDAPDRGAHRALGREAHGGRRARYARHWSGARQCPAWRHGQAPSPSAADRGGCAIRLKWP